MKILNYNNVSKLKERRFYQCDKFEENEPYDEDLFDYWDWREQTMIWNWYIGKCEDYWWYISECED